MNKDAKTYQTPHGAQRGAPEQPGAIRYGVVLRDQIAHEVAIIEETKTTVLATGPTFYGWVRSDEIMPEGAPVA